MKLHTTKFALAAATAITTFITIRQVLCKFFPNRLGIFGYLRHRYDYFIPEYMHHSTLARYSWKLSVTLLGILTVFVIAFFASLLFAAIYNKLVEEK